MPIPSAKENPKQKHSVCFCLLLRHLVCVYACVCDVSTFPLLRAVYITHGTRNAFMISIYWQRRISHLLRRTLLSIQHFPVARIERTHATYTQSQQGICKEIRSFNESAYRVWAHPGELRFKEYLHFAHDATERAAHMLA